MVLRLSPFLATDGMGVVEPDQSFTRWAVKRERIIQPVRLFRRGRNRGHDELHPMTAGRIDDEHLTVEIQQSVQTRVATLTHGMLLSYRDNYGKQRQEPLPMAA